MVPFRGYEISFLFLLLVKFYGSGKSEMYFYQKVKSVFTKCYLSSDIANGDSLFLNVMFAKMIFDLYDGFQQSVFQNFDMMLGFQSRDKRSLNNYDAIEIKRKGF